MGERALLARHHRLDLYDLSRTQWADSDRLVDTATRGRCPTEPRKIDWERCGQTRWATLIDDLDYLTLDLCVRCDGPLVRVYLPVWLGIPTGERDETDPFCGVLLRLESRREFSRLREWVRRQKEQLGLQIEHGTVGTEGAQRALLAAVSPYARYLSASARRRCTSE